MTAYYNEHEPYAAQWLRNLISAGHIAPGDVDDRDIQDVSAEDLKGYTQCHFFAGIGGWSYALRLSMWDDDRPVWTGSCPCQPISIAGHRKGHADERHLWPAFFRLISECRPPVVFGEQVAGKVGCEWLSAVRADLEDAGYAVGASDIPACSVGALHKRHRLWWVAADPNSHGSQVWPLPSWDREKGFWHEELEGLVQDVLRVSVPAGKYRALVDGIPGRVGQLRAYGNAIVPQVAAEFIQAVMEVAP